MAWFNYLFRLYSTLLLLFIFKCYAIETITDEIDSNDLIGTNININKSVATDFAAHFPLPLPVKGTCRVGDQFIIRSISDLYDNIANLECIFAAGLSPPKKGVPLGFNYGYMLAPMNTAFWDPIAQIAYQGDFVVRTKCKGKSYNIGWLSIAGVNAGTAVWSIDKFPFRNNLAQGEYPLGDMKNDGIIMDFTTNFKELCSVEGNECGLKQKGFSPFHNSPFPINNFIDIGRVVGRDYQDGGLITLNKAYLITEDKARTVILYATKSFDPTVMPNFAQNKPCPIQVPAVSGRGEYIDYERPALETIIPAIISRLKLFSGVF